jgi:hypothetical protein
MTLSNDSAREVLDELSELKKLLAQLTIKIDKLSEDNRKERKSKAPEGYSRPVAKSTRGEEHTFKVGDRVVLCTKGKYGKVGDTGIVTDIGTSFHRIKLDGSNTTTTRQPRNLKHEQFGPSHQQY